MKKKILSITLALFMCLSLGLLFASNKPNLKTSDYTVFSSNILEVCKNDNLQMKTLSKDASFEEIKQIIPETSEDDMEMFFDDKEEFFSSYGFSVNEKENDISVYSKFQLKRLIVNGNINDTYGATEIIDGYKDFTILSYDSEEATEIAYNKLSKNKKLSVSIDTILCSSGYADNSYDYSENKTGWGAKAVEYGGYIDYLENNLLNNKTKEDVIVVVIDTGINTSHTMFSGRIVTDENGQLVGKSYYPSTLGGARYGFEDDTTGSKMTGHGTHVSGIIVDNTPSFVKILPIKALNNTGSGSLSSLIAAIADVESYTEKYNIAAVNMSLGSTTYDETSKNHCESLFNGLRSKGILPIVAAGNDGANSEHVIPASCGNAIVVSAIKQNSITNSYEFAIEYSNYGHYIDIAAPGSDINSASVGGEDVYELKNGTSMATPFVSAAVSLMYTHYTNIPSFEGLSYEFTSILEDSLKENSIDLGTSGFDQYYGYGLVNLKYFDIEKSNETLTFTNSSTGSEIILDAKPIEFNTNIVLKVDCSSYNYKIFYTKDGAIPTKNSTQYQSTITISQKSKYRFIGIKFDNAGNVESYTDVYELLFTKKTSSSNDFYYTFVDSKPYISAYLGTASNVVIPTYYPGTTTYIKGIYENVFFGNSFIESVYIPTTCNTIMSKAFYHCCNLEIVEADGVSSINEYAFFNCHNLKEVTMPNLKTIGDYAFSGTALEVINGNGADFDDSVSVSDLSNLSSAGSHAFGDMENLIYASFDKLSTIGDYAFFSCNKLKEIHLDALTSIPNYSFFQCLSLDTFTIGQYVQTVGISAFNITNLNEFNLNSNNTYLYTDGIGLYQNHTLVAIAPQKNFSYSILDSVVINEETKYITSIQDETFAHKFMTYVQISPRIINIGKHAFSYSSFDVIDYNAWDLSNSYFFVNNYVSDPFYLSTIEKFNINESVNSLPDYLFYTATIKTLCINKYNIYLTNNVFSTIDIDYLYLNFSDPITKTYFANKLGDLSIFKADYIYSKSNFNSSKNYAFIVNTGTESITKTFYYNGQTDGYYLYATSPDAVPHILYSTTDYEGEYDGKHHIFDIRVESSTTCSVYFGLTSDSCTIPEAEINQHDVFKNATNGPIRIYFVLKASGYTDTVGFAYINITKVNLSVKLNDFLDIVYGDPISVSNNDYTLKSGSIVSGDTIELFITTTAKQFSPVHEYPITATVSDSVINYNIEIINGTYKVNKRKIHIEIDDKRGIYGELNLSNKDYKITSGVVVNNDNLNIVLKYNTTTFDYGQDYEISLSYSNGNYDLTYDKGTLVVDKRKIVFEILNKESIYGYDINLDKFSDFIIKEGSFVNNDEELCGFYVSTTATSSSNAHTYEIVGNYNTMNNYDISVINGTYTISPRPISISLKNSESLYGDAIVLNNSYYEVTSGEFFEDDELFLGMKISTTATNTSNFNTYPITCTHNEMPNYILSITDAEYQVKKRSITFTINPASSYYGDNIVLKGYEITNGRFMFNDEETCNFSISTTATSLSDSSNYDILGSYNETAMQTNYEITVIPSTYTISKREIVVTLDSKEITYGEAAIISNEEYEITSGSFIGTDESLLKLAISTNASQSVTKPSNAGTYEIIGTSVPLTNYNVTVINGTYTINKRNIEITLIDQSQTYGNAVMFNNNYTVNSGTIVNNDNLNIRARADINSLSPVGEYRLYGECNNSNYNCKINDAKFEITKRVIKIKLNNQKAPHFSDFTLDQTAYEIVEGSVLNTDTLNIQILSHYDRFRTFWGEIEIYGEYFNKNYEVIFENAVLSIEISVYDTLGAGAICFVLLCFFTIISAAKGKNGKNKKKKKKGSSAKSKSKNSSKNNSKTNSSDDTPKTYV